MSPPFSTLFSNPLPRPSILPYAEREWTCGRWKRHPGKLEMCRGVTIAWRRKGRGDGNDRGTIRLDIGEEEEAKSWGEERTQRHPTTRGRGKGQSEETRSTLCL